MFWFVAKSLLKYFFFFAEAYSYKRNVNVLIFIHKNKTILKDQSGKKKLYILFLCYKTRCYLSSLKDSLIDNFSHSWKLLFLLKIGSLWNENFFFIQTQAWKTRIYRMIFAKFLSIFDQSLDCYLGKVLKKTYIYNKARDNRRYPERDVYSCWKSFQLNRYNYIID